MDAAGYYRDHLKQIDEAICIICRKQGLVGDEEKDFAQHVHLLLIENDYRRIRAYNGASSLKTYLHTVIGRIFIDRVRHKWNPSAEAKRIGAAAVELEKLVYRHQYAVHEACGILASNAALSIDERTAHEIIGKLHRNPGVTVLDDSEEHLPRVPDPALDPEQRIVQKQLQQKKQHIVAFIGDILQSLSEEDKLFIKLFFVSGHKISEISRMLGKDDRLLYKEMQSILRNLRESMADAGVGQADIQDVLHEMSEFDD